MSKLFLLLLIFVLGTVITLFPETTEPKDFFPYSDMKLHLATHVYFIFERVTLIILAWLIAAEARQYRGALQVFFWLVVVDFLDYIVTYNSVWFRLGGFPVSMNILKVLIFSIALTREWIKTLQRTYR